MLHNVAIKQTNAITVVPNSYDADIFCIDHGDLTCFFSNSLILSHSFVRSLVCSFVRRFGE